MSKQLKLEKIRTLLNDRDRNAALHHLNGLPDNQQVQWLKKALQTLEEAPASAPTDFQELMRRIEIFSAQGPNKVKEKLLHTLQEVYEYNRTGINPYSKQAQFEGLSVDSETVIYEDTSLLGLLININSKYPDLDWFIGDLNDWIENCSKKDWQKRIASLKALKELEPVKGKIAEMTTDGRTIPGYDKMKLEAQKYLDKNKESLKNKYRGDKSPFVEKEIIPHLEKKYPKAKKYPSVSYLRVNVLEW